MKNIGVSAVLIAALSLVSACGGGGAKQTTTVTTTTAGQELVDLKAALDSGAITQAEYEKKRAEILKRKS